MHEAGAVVLELPVLIFLPALLLVLLGQAVYLVAHQQAVDIRAVSLWHHRLGGVEQVVERQPLVSQGKQQCLLAQSQDVLRVLASAASVFWAFSVLPAVDGAQADEHLCRQNAIGFGATVVLALDKPLPLLFIGSCVRMELHACCLSCILVGTRKITACTAIYPNCCS